MITPPLSICARPALTRMVPVRAPVSPDATSFVCPFMMLLQCCYDCTGQQSALREQRSMYEMEPEQRNNVKKCSITELSKRLRSLLMVQC